MTAPGNSVVLLILLASFVGSTGYAAGRLHQWYRMDQERDEAYRVGYDMATRNVFSLAARMIGPRRERAAVRGSASVHRSSSMSSGSPSPSASSPSPSASSPSGSSSPVSSPLSSSPVVSSSVTPVVPSLLPSPVSPSPVSPALPSSVLPSPVSPSPVSPNPVSPTPVSPASVPSWAGPPSGASGPSPSDSPGVTSSAVSSRAGFESFRASSRSASSESQVVSGDSDRHDGSAGSRGRHTVPDELVQAATYRLTPDRVARAKVRQKPAADLPDDQTSRLPELPNGVSVPKPRSS